MISLLKFHFNVLFIKNQAEKIKMKAKFLAEYRAEHIDFLSVSFCIFIFIILFSFTSTFYILFESLLENFCLRLDQILALGIDHFLHKFLLFKSLVFSKFRTKITL